MICPDTLGDLSLSSCLLEYLARTKEKRAYFERAEGRPSHLFLSHTRPFQPVTAATLAKWLLKTMGDCGLNTDQYKAHSTRSAGATDLLRRGLTLTQVLKRGNWAPGSRSFKIFYNRA